jgi:hypothetical protein
MTNQNTSAAGDQDDSDEQCERAARPTMRSADVH